MYQKLFEKILSLGDVRIFSIMYNAMYNKPIRGYTICVQYLWYYNYKSVAEILSSENQSKSSDSYIKKINTFHYKLNKDWSQVMINKKYDYVGVPPILVLRVV